MGADETGTWLDISLQVAMEIKYFRANEQANHHTYVYLPCFFY